MLPGLVLTPLANGLEIWSQSLNTDYILDNLIVQLQCHSKKRLFRFKWVQCFFKIFKCYSLASGSFYPLVVLEVSH